MKVLYGICGLITIIIAPAIIMLAVMDRFYLTGVIGVLIGAGIWWILFLSAMGIYDAGRNAK
jgi:hypothetical protein